MDHHLRRLVAITLNTGQIWAGRLVLISPQSLGIECLDGVGHSVERADVVSVRRIRKDECPANGRLHGATAPRHQDA